MTTNETPHGLRCLSPPPRRARRVALPLLGAEVSLGFAGFRSMRAAALLA